MMGEEGSRENIKISDLKIFDCDTVIACQKSLIHHEFHSKDHGQGVPTKLGFMTGCSDK